MIDVTKASRETAERCVKFACRMNQYWKELSPEMATELASIKDALCAECAAPKLRSRAVVDAEIVRTVRDNVRLGSDEDCLTLTSSPRFRDPAETIRRLCAEPTAEEPAELDLSEHEVDPDPAEKRCGCTNEVRYRKALERVVEQMRSIYKPTAELQVLAVFIADAKEALR